MRLNSCCYNNNNFVFFGFGVLVVVSVVFFHGMSPKVFRTLVPSTVLFVVCRGSAVLLEVNIVPLFRETISIASST